MPLFKIWFFTIDNFNNDDGNEDVSEMPGS